MQILRYLKYLCYVAVIALIVPIQSLATSDFQHIQKFIGTSDAVLLANPHGDILFNINADKKLVPASTLKLFTSLVAIHYLGENFHFSTDFYLDADSNLKIKGYGDPLLISENISQIPADLSRKIKFINNIIVDDTYFEKPINIPGTAINSLQPYDAPNGALCVNFNTVNFIHIDNKYITNEPQTPLLDIARKHIKTSHAKSGRIMLTNDGDEITRYAGELFKYFIELSGINVKGSVKPGTVDAATDQLVLRHISKFVLTGIIARLLEYSNNYIANQIFLASGAKAFGPPASIEKAIQAAKIYADAELGIKDLSIIEGSGISRKNRLSAKMFLKILSAFKPYHGLMRYKDGKYYKTGTLNGINTLVGYIEDSNSALYPFVILLNTPGERTSPVIKQLKKMID